MPRKQAWLPLAVSIGLHAVPLAHALGTPAPAPVPPPLAPLAAPAALPGETFDIDALALKAPPSPPSLAAPPPASVPAAGAVLAPERPARERQPSEEPRATVAPAALEPRAMAPAPRAAASAASASTPAAAAQASGSYGEEQALARAAPLSKGLLRVLPRVAYPEAAFHRVPLGTTARTRFSIDLDESGRIAPPPRFDQHAARDVWLDDVVVRACLLLRGGMFGLAAGEAGTHAFELKFEVVQGTPREGDWLEPTDLAEIGRLVEPTLLQPGRAHFIYNSGRQVRLTLSLGAR